MKRQDDPPRQAGCPIADNLFDELTNSFGDEEPSGEVKSTLELFIEQFSTSVLEEKLLGIELRTRDRLEERLDHDNLDPKLGDLIAATTDLCREVAAQGYVALGGIVSDYAIPWMEALEAWMSVVHPACPALRSLIECLDAARAVA